METNDENPFGDPVLYNSASAERPAAVIDATTAQINLPQSSELLSSSSSSSKVPTGFMEQVQRMDSHPVRIMDDSQPSNSSEMGGGGAGASGVTNVHSNNWPPLPDFCCWKPCFYHDITIDIRPEFQTIVYQLYYLWLSHSLPFVSLFVGYLLARSYVMIIQFSIVAALMTALSFLFWYRPIYKAFRDDSAINFIAFFLAFSVQILIFGYHAIKWIAISFFEKDDLNMIGVLFIFLAAAGFVVITCVDVFMIVKVHGIYTSSGATINKARDEFMQNEQVRSFAANTLASAMSSQFQQSNRY